jgi:hypothetical protein
MNKYQNGFSQNRFLVWLKPFYAILILFLQLKLEAIQILKTNGQIDYK